MKYLVKTLALATAIAAFSSPALAADDDIDILLAPESTLVEVGSGWYLRGDITASVNGSRITENFSNGTSEESSVFGDMIGGGIGAGYNFNNNFRAEVMWARNLVGQAEFFTQYPDGGAVRGYIDLLGKAHGNCAGYFEAVGGLADKLIENCSEYGEASYNASTLMANGYFDLNPVGKFQPYIGAGLGVARVRWQEVTGGTICSPVPAAVNLEGCYGGSGADQPPPNSVYIYGGTKAGGIDYRLAYSVSAGFSYRIKEKFLLDFGYRFLGVSDTFGIAGGATKAQQTAKNGFGLHQINLGLRYEIW